MGNVPSKSANLIGNVGSTFLPDGSVVDKDIPRLEATGTIEELNSVIGFARSQILIHEPLSGLIEALRLIQQDLLELGGALSNPGEDLLSQTKVSRLKATIEEWSPHLLAHSISSNKEDPPAVGALLIARSICRRSERRLVTALVVDPQPGKFGLAYLNLLSDFLLLASRLMKKE
ncbi:ATP:cob(I)alamin adenosyltransferase [Rhodobacteraceae bacterium HSP-20]|uniref:Corrinoid adenosyltransferase n=1 Tax=Paragemmobacter amnigenus TaxID=2852097 RepID=A0ABS6J5D5_9RHOB|nr:ATP:cob(I)alamin adenosyltransferase [Rhodobacter amnigenus]MBU9698975.1 ATP:cob(I)alamin adenosyltransferase [Rhodobacter amnigenus]MBV4390202.1 ATP:cob(I)alamin adenosyltransferase [Rhodobacter amnigenus]